jgi:mRNA interferase MazF
MTLRLGDVIVVPFPFTDQTTIKRRPAVVISSGRYNLEWPDFILMAITSQMRPTPAVGEVAVVQWQAAGLLKPSVIKPLITTIEATLVIRKLGALSSSTIRNRSAKLSRRSSGSGVPAAAHHRPCANASTASGAMRTAFRIRTCARAPRAQSLYTVASQTRSRRATSATERSAPRGTPTCLSFVGGAFSGSKIGAKFFEFAPNPGEPLDDALSRS